MTNIECNDEDDDDDDIANDDDDDDDGGGDDDDTLTWFLLDRRTSRTKSNVITPYACINTCMNKCMLKKQRVCMQAYGCINAYIAHKYI